tara:strand:+ start:1747 stop:2190 length:444 start_codon:yes stop_codon:yes gene_type:complete
MSDLPGREVHILLIEDNEGDVILMKAAFAEGKLAKTVHVCSTGEEGMSFLRREGSNGAAPRPDLVLLDLNLPGMSGHDVLRQVKENEDLREIPVVVMTSSSAEQDVVQSYRLHANSYIVKPVGMDKLIEITRAIETFWFQIVKTPRL